MISFLRGKLVKKSPTHIIVDVGGIGYLVWIPLSNYDHLPDIDKDIKILTHLHLRDNEIQLFGFLNFTERSLFEKLIGVSGVGPQLALGVLSAMSTMQFKQAIFQNDTKALMQIPRVGKKMAERLILELKDAFKDFDLDDVGDTVRDDEKEIIEEAVLALVSLGYKEMAARSAIVKARAKFTTTFTSEDLVREGLQCIN